MPSTSTQENFHQLAKIELHRHLEGSMRLTTLAELAQAQGFTVPQDPVELAEQFLVTKPMLDLNEVLQKFTRAQAVLTTPQIIERLTFEVITDAAKENIRLLELRYAPTYIEQNHQFKNWDEIHQAVMNGIKNASHLPIAVGVIGIIQRIQPVTEAQNVMDFFIEHRDSFVGVDLADSEVGFDCKPFADLFRRAKNAGFGITIHAGEAIYPQTIQSVRDAVEILGADRIGHGIQIYKDTKAIDWACKKNIVFEICPTSNWLTQAIQHLHEHPLAFLHRAGVRTTINSDDPDLFGIDLSNELHVAQNILGLTETEINQCQKTAFEASFIADKIKQQYDHWSSSQPDRQAL